MKKLIPILTTVFSVACVAVYSFYYYPANSGYLIPCHSGCPLDAECFCGYGHGYLSLIQTILVILGAAAVGIGFGFIINYIIKSIKKEK